MLFSPLHRACGGFSLTTIRVYQKMLRSYNFTVLGQYIQLNLCINNIGPIKIAIFENVHVQTCIFIHD